MIDREMVFRCPLKLINGITWEYVKAYRFYKKGLLPNGKSWQDESQKFLDAMVVLENEVSRVEKEEMKARKKNG